MKINIFRSIVVIFFLMSSLMSDTITAIPLDNSYDKKKAYLGKKLFYDVRLSGDNSISCSNCHNLYQGGANSTKYSFGVGGQMGHINTPTVFNAVYNFAQMWEGSAKNLKEQALMPITNPIEMNATVRDVVFKLKQDIKYKKEFDEIYDDSITGDNILDAIAEFEKALTTPNSRFDKYLRGDKSAISKYEADGYRLFKEYGCISCHNGVNLGSNLYQTIGVVKPYTDKSIDAKYNLGRYNFTKKVDDKYMFKVPTLRNIELTAPYLHNGSLKDLKSVVKFMLEYQVGVSISEDNINKLVAFLKTLTGEKPYILRSKNEK